MPSRFFHPFLKQSACSQAPFYESLTHLPFHGYFLDRHGKANDETYNYFMCTFHLQATQEVCDEKRLLGFRRPLTFIKGSRQYHSLSIKLFLENLTKTMYFPLLAFSLVNNITNYLSRLT